MKEKYYDKDGNEIPHWSLAHISDEEMSRYKAVEHIEEAWEVVKSAFPKKDLIELASTDVFHRAIWYASTVILPKLEVQVVIDANGKAFASTGSAGYVDYSINPIKAGMKLPVACWIHTHPFGSAYFSGTDIRTVSIYQPMMKSAIVLGGKGHYGVWTQAFSKQLRIYRDYRFDRIQSWAKKEEEE